MQFVLRKPGVAYFDSHLWLPKSHISEYQLRGSLVYDPGGAKKPLQAWAEQRHHFVVPRNYFLPGVMQKLPFPVYDARLRTFPRVSFRSKLVLDALAPEKTMQRDASVALLNTHDGILCVRCGGGKALHNDEPVLTTEGWKRIADLKVGMHIVGSDAKPYPVQGVYPQGGRELFDVIFSDGTKIRADGDHLWHVHRQAELYTGQGGGRALTTAQLQAKGLTFKGGQYKHFVRMADPLPYVEKNLPIEPYLLGVLLGDGGLTSGVSATTDVEILVNLELPAGTCFSKNHTKVTDTVETWWIVGKAGPGKKNILRDQIKELGLNVRSEHKHIPPDYLTGSIEQRLSLLQGLLDTDGAADLTSRGQVEYSTSSERLATQVVEIVQSLGGISNKTRRQTYYTYKGEKKPGLPSYRCNVRLPPELAPFRLSRKLEQYLPRGRSLTRSIRKIIPAGKGPATCISVGSPDHLFRTRGHILTHNTAIAVHTASLLHVPVLVQVDNTGLAEQWKEEILEITDLTEEQIGMVGDGEFDWENKPITIALMQTLAGRAHKKKLPPEFMHRFGVCLIDEAHVVGGPWINASVPPFHGRRWALTATPTRNDVYDSLLRYTVGEIVYSFLEPELIPKVYFKGLPTKLDMTNKVTIEATTDCNEEPHLQRIYGFLSEDDKRLKVIVGEIKAAIANGRQVLVLSQSRKMVEELGRRIPEAGLCHGGVTDRKERLRRIRECNPVIAIARLGRQALNKPALDTLFVCEPFSNMNVLQQIMGRVLRLYGAKQHPVVVFYDEFKITALRNMCMRIRGILNRWPKSMGGRIKFTNVAV